jgi:ubiquinone biosynthesis protein UbiJ
LDSDLAQETRALRQQLADVKNLTASIAAERQQASYERAAFTAQTSALDDRMARLEDMISRLSSGPRGDPNQAMLATQANMQ